MKSGVNQYTKSSPVPDSAHTSNDCDKGKARDIVASKLKFTSGREVDRVITTAEFLDTLDMIFYLWERRCKELVE